MNRRSFLLTAAGSPALLRGKPERRPNILYIMADDHAAHAISAYGSRINSTPNIDRIAQDGVRLDNCFCTNSICTPSRATILTGEYSHRNGVKTLNDPLDPAHNNVGRILQAGGYSTAMIGKWHLHKNPSGFDHWRILPGQGLYHNPDFLEEGGRKKYQGYATDLITDFSLEWLQRRPKDKPFFLMCHHKAPHRPWEPDEKHAHLYDDVKIPEPGNLFDDYENRWVSAREATMRVGENMNIPVDLKRPAPEGLRGNELRRWAYQYYIKDYLRCIASVDDNVGRLLDYLRAANLEQDTVVIYTSDQGFFLGDHGWYDKRFMYEESLRMPFILRYPREVRAGAVNRDMTLNLDFAELFLDYAGLGPAAEMQGRSFRQNLLGRTPKDWRRSMYYRYWMHLADHGVAAHYGVRTDRYKLVYYYGKALGCSGAIDRDTPAGWELFDLEKDPHEMRSVYTDRAYASVVRELTGELAKLQKQYGDTPVAAT